MKKKILIPVIILIIAILTGCSSAAIPSQATSTTADTSTSALSATELAAGTLELQNTDNAVTADQASDLLTLWLAYQEVNTRDTASTDETAALVNQITSTMTTEQIAAIQAMNLSTSDMEALTGATSTQSASASTNSASQSAPAGAPADGGMMGGDMGSGEAPSDSGQTMASANPQNQQDSDDLVLSLIKPLTEMLETLTI